MTEDLDLEEKVARGLTTITGPLMHAFSDLSESLPSVPGWGKEEAGRCTAAASIAIRTAWEAACRRKLTGHATRNAGQGRLLLKALNDAAPIFTWVRAIEDEVVQADIQETVDTFEKRWKGNEWPDGFWDSVHVLVVFDALMVPVGVRHGHLLTALRSVIACAHEVIMPYPVPELEELAAQRRREGT